MNRRTKSQLAHATYFTIAFILSQLFLGMAKVGTGKLTTEELLSFEGSKALLWGTPISFTLVFSALRYGGRVRGGDIELNPYYAWCVGGILPLFFIGGFILTFISVPFLLGGATCTAGWILLIGATYKWKNRRMPNKAL